MGVAAISGQSLGSGSPNNTEQVVNPPLANEANKQLKDGGRFTECDSAVKRSKVSLQDLN